MINWQLLNTYVNSGDGMGVYGEPQVLLYHERTGLVLGKIIKWSDGDFITVAANYHGFSFTHFAFINLPEA